MKTNGVIINVHDVHIETGDFNRGEHLRVKIEPDKFQTVSCELPNGRFVTFAFIPGPQGDIRCVDIHSTNGPAEKRPDGSMGYAHHLIGFTQGGPHVFTTRNSDMKCVLATLVLNDR